MTSFNDVFGSQNAHLERVVIQAYGSTQSNVKLPAGYVLEDFEYMDFYGTSTAAPERTRGFLQISKERLQSTNAQLGDLDIEWGNTVKAIHIQRVSDSELSFLLTTGDEAIQQIIGYTKRYASRNLSAIVNVNGGNDIAVNSRYEIDIATELGQDYVGRDLMVQAEVYNDGTDGSAGWGSAGSSDFIQDTGGTLYGSGVEASTLGDKIIVQTGASFLLRASQYCGNPFGNSSNHTSLPCRVKVWKIDQFITKTLNGGANVVFDVQNTTPINVGAGDAVLMNVSRTGTNGTAEVNLPTNPNVGSTITIGDYDGSCSILNPIVIKSNNNIHSQSEDLILASANIVAQLQYVSGDVGWKIIDGVGIQSSVTELPYEEVLIHSPANGVITAGTYSLPSGYTWSDFEKVEFEFGHSAYEAGGTTTLTKEMIALNGGQWSVIVSYAANYITAKAGNSAGHGGDVTKQFFLQNHGSGYGIRQIKGYTKYKPVLNRGKTLLWSGQANTGGAIQTSQPVTEFDDVCIEGFCPSSNYGCSKTVRSAFLVDQNRVNVEAWAAGAGQHARMELVVTDASNFTCYFTGTVGSYVGAITAIYGIKY